MQALEKLHQKFYKDCDKFNGLNFKNLFVKLVTNRKESSVVNK